MSISLLLLTFVGIIGCSQDFLLDESTLSVSKNEIVLPGLGHTTTSVEVNSSTADWIFIKGAQWIKVERTSSGLNISADDNTSGLKRTATIIISANKKVDKIEVTQLVAGTGEESISVETKNIHANQWGGTFTISVSTTSDNWNAKLSEEWLSASVNPKKGAVIVTIPAAEERKTRTATLIIEDNETGNTCAVEISQDGILYYYLPYLKYGATQEEIEAYELSRQSIILERPQPGNAASTNKDLLKVRTISPLFYRVEYRFEDDVMVEATLYAAYATMATEEAAILTFLLENNFYQDTANTLFNKETRAQVKTGVLKDGSEWYVRFSEKPLQPTPQPTFTELPLGLVAEKDWPTYNKDRIRTWEEANEGTSDNPDGIVDSFSGIRQITYTSINGSNRPYAKSVYLLALSTDDVEPLKRVSHIFPASDECNQKFWWIHKNKYLITDEFMVLTKKAGFEYVGVATEGSHAFVNAARMMQMGVKINAPQAPSTVPYVTITYYYTPQ